MGKRSFMRVVDILLWLMGLILAAGYYFQHQGTSQAYWGFIGLTASFIISFVFKVIKFLARIFMFLFLLVVGYLVFVHRPGPKDPQGSRSAFLGALPISRLYQKP